MRWVLRVGRSVSSRREKLKGRVGTGEGRSQGSTKRSGESFLEIDGKEDGIDQKEEMS